jgi:hypothetical protein
MPAILPSARHGGYRGPDDRVAFLPGALPAQVSHRNLIAVLPPPASADGFLHLF